MCIKVENAKNNQYNLKEKKELKPPDTDFKPSVPLALGQIDQ